MIFALVMMTVTPRARTITSAGAMKSAAPCTSVALSRCSPSRASTPISTAATMNSAASWAKDQPSSQPYGVASALPVSALAHGMTEKIMKAKTRATATSTSFCSRVSTGGSAAASAASSRSPGRKPVRERPGAARIRRA